MLTGSIDWTTVIVAALSALPGSLAAFVALSVRKRVSTPSGDPIGHVVERSHETAVANNLLLRRMNGWTVVTEEESDAT